MGKKECQKRNYAKCFETLFLGIVLEQILISNLA